jgi:hypothetical protein
MSIERKKLFTNAHLLNFMCSAFRLGWRVAMRPTIGCRARVSILR